MELLVLHVCGVFGRVKHQIKVLKPRCDLVVMVKGGSWEYRKGGTDRSCCVPKKVWTP